jgi:hypothetical protein
MENARIKIYKVFSFVLFLGAGSNKAFCIETPIGVYFDEVGSTTIVASAYAPPPAFTGLGAGLAGVNVSKDGIYPPWRNGNGWKTKAAMPTARGNPSAGVIGGKLFVMGGRSAGYFNVNEEYDPAADVWTVKAGMPTARQQFSIGVAGGKLYAVGGHNGGYLKANEEYDPETNTWSVKAGMPEARDAISAAVIKDKVYVAGGAYMGNGVNTNFEYDPVLNTWETKASMPTARHSLATGVVGGKLYAMGGAFTGGRNTSVNEEYDPVSDTWSLKALMPTPRGNFATGMIGGKLYAVGGQGNTVSGSAHLNANEEYDPLSDIWSIRAGMPTPRDGLAVGVIGGRLYAAGGYNGSDGYLDTIEEYDPGVSLPFRGLTPNTLYTFKAKARDAAGIETAESPAVSTYTLALTPAAAQRAFTFIGRISFAANWLANGNPAGTLYHAQVSTSASFMPALSSDTYRTSAGFTRLASGTTYYSRVAAINGSGIMTSYADLGFITTAGAVGNAVPELAWAGGVNYISDGVAPAVGTAATRFMYRVKYLDADNDAPLKGHPKVHISKAGSRIYGSPFAMKYISGNNRTGAVYAYSRTLPPGNDYSYYFTATDVTGAFAGGAPTGVSLAPVVAEAEKAPEGLKAPAAGASVAGVSGIRVSIPSVAGGGDIRLPGVTNIAVAEFAGRNVSEADASIVTDFLRTELVNTGLYKVMDRNNMDTVLAEQKFQNSGCTEQGCAVEIGKLLNVRRMYVGSLSKLLDNYYITVNVVDVSTGEIVASYNSDAVSAKKMRDACKKAVEKLSKK